MSLAALPSRPAALVQRLALRHSGERTCPRGGQKQTQIINTARGRATPRALPIVNANAESKSVSSSRPDMTHSKEPPRALLVAQRMNDQKKQAIEPTGIRPDSRGERRNASLICGAISAARPQICFAQPIAACAERPLYKDARSISYAHAGRDEP